MSSANQQNNSLLRSVVNIALLAGITAGFAVACVSSSNSSNGTGGSSNGGESSAATGGASNGGAANNGGTSNSNGGAQGTGGAAAPDCNLGTGVVTGNACSPNPQLFTIQDNGGSGSCGLGLWANDGTSGGYIFSPWCNTPGGTDCTLTMSCSGGTLTIGGSYNASGGAAAADGNGGFGLNLQTTFADAGPGCQMISGAGLTGLSVDINNINVPKDQSSLKSTLIIGLTLANGNAAEYTATLTAGAQTIKMPFTGFSNKKNCGSIPGPGIVNMYFVYPWLNDGTSHAVSMTLSNLGFY